MKKIEKEIYVSEYTVNDSTGCRVYENGNQISIEDQSAKTIHLTKEQAKKIALAIGLLLKDLPD